MSMRLGPIGRNELQSNAEVIWLTAVYIRIIFL